MLTIQTIQLFSLIKTLIIVLTVIAYGIYINTFVKVIITTIEDNTRNKKILRNLLLLIMLIISILILTKLN